MGIVYGSNEDTVEDTNAVLVAAGPSEGERVVFGLSIYNTDGSSQTILIKYEQEDGSTTFVVHRETITTVTSVYVQKRFVLRPGTRLTMNLNTGSATLHFVASYFTRT